MSRLTKPGAVCEKCHKVHVERLKNGARRCQAHRASVRPYVQCGAAANFDSPVCRKHGGNTARGPAAPAFRHGGYSKYLPVPLAEAYEAALADPDLISLRDELALVDARLRELVSKLTRGDTAPARAVENAAARVESAVQKQDAAELFAALEELRRVAAVVRREERVWDEVRLWQEQRRRLTETERRRLEALSEYVTRDRMLTLVTALVSVLKDEVRDRGTLGRVVERVREISRRVSPPTPTMQGILDVVRGSADDTEREAAG